MNKKFSTLVAALLASGGLFYAVDAMVLPMGEGVAQYVTAVTRTTETGEFTGYSFATEDFNAETSCIWKMVQVDATSTYNLTATVGGQATYYLAADASGNLVMQADAKSALAFTLDKATGKLTADEKVLSIADGVLSLQAAESEIAAGLFKSDKAAITEANTTDALALGTIVSTQEMVALTTDSEVLNWADAVEGTPAALDGLKNLSNTETFGAQEKWSIADGMIKAADEVLLTAGGNDEAPTLGAEGTAISLQSDGAIKLGEVWLKIASSAITCSTAEPTATEKVYLYSAANKVVTVLGNAQDLVISTMTTKDVISDVTGKVATVKAEFTTPATPADNLPGLDNATVDAEGKVTAIDEGVTTVAAPFYFNTGKTYLSVTKDKDGIFVIATGKDAISSENGNQPTGAQSAAASWRLEDGNLISVASERAGTPMALSTVALTKADDPVYILVPVSAAPTVTLGNDGVVTFAKGGKTENTTANLYVSATSVNIDPYTYTSGYSVTSGTQKSADQKLLTSVPSGYAIIGVKQANGMEYLYANADGSVTTETFNGLNYEGYLWKVSETNDNKTVYYYQFTSLRTKDNKAIQWIIDGRAQFTGGVKYEGNGFTLSHPSGNITEDGVADPTGQKAVIGFYEAPLCAFTLNYLNDILKPGFEMTVEVEKDSKNVLENIDIFSGKIYPAEDVIANNFVLWNNKDFDKGTDAKMLVLNKASIDGDNAKGAFEWITKKAYDKDPSNYETVFRFLYDLSTPTTDVVSKVKVGSYTLSILEVDKKFYLTSVKTVTDNTKLPYIKLGANNVYPVKNLLGKLWNISYADTKANAKADGEEYKLNGILAVTYDKNGKLNKADYVASNTVAEAAPEAQWIVTSADLNSNTFTLTNRENKNIEITGIKLRLRDGNKFEVYGTSNTNLEVGDIIYLNESVKKDNFQGYMQTTENTLRSNNYFLGQYHAIDGNHNAYLVENHANSHQIGAVADQEAADKWKLHFAMKADDDNKYTEVDTVKIITAYATLNAAGNGWETDSKKIKRDTLYILPYTFQKVANREFVAFNPENKTNMDFYACDEDNKDNSVGNYTNATRFALKVKPNGYNFVEIDGTVNSASLSANKAYLANSANKGSLERMQTYAADNNSVMVVEAADASEYHKIAQAWGDTIKLFRDENNAQVMFEKFDAKSIVANDTLSFLNIDNVNQFNVNPAIFADTAYINRWDADGVLNTTYQYLLTLNPSFGLHTEDCEIPGHEPIVGGIDTVYGRFLVNLIDTANVYGVNHIHNNWYINESEAGEKRAKLSFVEGYHTNDTLYLTRQGGEIVKIGMTDPAFNVAKFAFRYVDSDAKTFKIQTQFKEYLGDENEYDSAEEFARAYANRPSLVSNEGYLKWINGTVVVEKGYENGDVFGIEENYAGNPTANENVTTVSGISVAATNGAVIIKGAEGKKVSIVNVLGQSIANTVITSSEATIAAPAGVVVVAVEGEEAVKAIVK